MLDAFLAGRTSYDDLTARLKTATAEEAAAIGRALALATETGRMPADIAIILRSALPTFTATPPAENQMPRALFEEETVPHAFTPSPEWARNTLDRNPDGTPDAHDQRSVDVTPPMPEHRPPLPPAGLLPPMPSLSAAEALPGFDQLRDRVDDAVLSGLIGDYKALRSPGLGMAPDDAGGRRPDPLGNLLGSYRSARFRSAARRIAREGAGNGTSLGKLSDFSNQRAGVGTILRDRFILDAEIGRGGMGVVYSAVDRRRLEAGNPQPYVAMKLLNEAFRSNSNALRTLEAEARKAQSLAHPNIATVFDFDRDRAEVFIVMELLTGKPLNKLLATATGRSMPAGLIASVLQGLCSGLSYAHARGVIHSDLKPGNIFVGDDGQAKLIDFGLATAGEGAGFDAGELGALTAAYASPEMFDGAPRDPRDDIFALGCIAYQMFVGFHPYAMKAANEARAEGLRPDPVPDLDPAAWQSLDGALRFSRDERPASVDAFARALFET